MALTPEQIAEAVERLTQIGLSIEIRLPWDDEPPESSVENIVELARDPDAFWARFAGVTVTHYRYWQAWQWAGSPCVGCGATGKVCRLRTQSPMDFIGPRQLRPGTTDRCKKHQGAAPDDVELAWLSRLLRPNGSDRLDAAICARIDKEESDGSDGGPSSIMYIVDELRPTVARLMLSDQQRLRALNPQQFDDHAAGVIASVIDRLQQHAVNPPG